MSKLLPIAFVIGILAVGMISLGTKSVSMPATTGLIEGSNVTTMVTTSSYAWMLPLGGFLFVIAFVLGLKGAFRR